MHVSACNAISWKVFEAKFEKVFGQQFSQDKGRSSSGAWLGAKLFFYFYFSEALKLPLSLNENWLAAENKEKHIKSEENAFELTLSVSCAFYAAVKSCAASGGVYAMWDSSLPSSSSSSSTLWTANCSSHAHSLTPTIPLISCHQAEFSPSFSPVLRKGGKSESSCQESGRPTELEKLFNATILNRLSAALLLLNFHRKWTRLSPTEFPILL